ncbi:MAG TPA: hypothetical protein VN026_19375 [Bacteroidia bacterium]|jgi:hypothetical protein|nr:hypothetical protein [Bacteroidia bacterium]
MKWKGKLINYLKKELESDTNKAAVYEKIISEENSIGIHLAIFNEPYMSLIFAGEKTIESRFSINRVGPFAKISKGDVVLIKKSGGPVLGYFIAGDIEYISNVTPAKIREIERNYGKQIGTQYDPLFWEERERANYITLISVKKIKRVPPFITEKKDRMGWVVLRQKENELFEE